MPRLNLRNKLLLFSVVIAIIPLIIAGQSLIRIARDEMKSSANDQLVTTAGQVTDEIDDLFEHAWIAPLLLIRNAIDEEGLGVQEKISLLTHGIADLPDIVALQITIEGGRLPLIVSQDRYSNELKAASVDPLTVLRTPPEMVAAFMKSGKDREVRVDDVAKVDKRLATVILPLKAPIANARAVFSAKIDLGRVGAAIARHPFQKSGSITILDREGHRVFSEGSDAADDELANLDIVKRALTLLSSGTPVISVETYQRPDGTAMLGAFAFSEAFKWVALVEKKESDAYFAVGEMIKSLGVWLATGLTAAALGAIVFAFRISRPILKIGEAAIEVAKGNFRARVGGVRTRDEIGDLAERFDTMIMQINERFQLAKFVSGGTIAAIQKSDAEGIKLGGERREVAILFADIRGYTAFAESRDPELVVEILNYYFQKITDQVAAHDGDVDKFVGDQIMAIFVGEKMAANAAACSLDIQDVMVALTKEHPEWELEIGIGVDMGEVVMGAMGSKERMDYTVLGDHVNLAARLCGYAAPQQTIVSESVGDKLKASPDFRLEPLEPITVKGKTGALNVFAVMRAGPAVPRTVSETEAAL
jgi:adenylate cyclase